MVGRFLGWGMVIDSFLPPSWELPLIFMKACPTCKEMMVVRVINANISIPDDVIDMGKYINTAHQYMSRSWNVGKHDGCLIVCEHCTYSEVYEPERTR